MLVRKEQEFVVNVDDDVWVRGNAEGLQIVLSNLVSNAIKYTNPHGTVELRVTSHDGHAIIRVTDNGIGIRAENLTNIFNLFDRGTATGPGSGIGLTLSKELVDAHKGTIDIESVVGEGTTVEVRIAALVSDEAISDPAAILGQYDLDLFIDTEEMPSDGPEPVADESRLPHVLIGEDNKDMRQYTVDLLGREYSCFEAADGRAGLEAATLELPDLIISDVMMPLVDGFELLHSLREDIHTSHIPVILLTALDDHESRIRGLTERADDYISKPFNRRELILRVRNLLELTRIRARRW